MSAPGKWDDLAMSSYQDSEDFDHVAPPPAPDTDAMLYGIIGEVARTAAQGREIHPVAVAAACLSWLSAEVGPNIYLPIGDTWHHANLYTLHIGRSARGGKGEALGLVHRLRYYLKDYHEGLLGQTHMGGLSSREGLAMAVADSTHEESGEIAPEVDKRLWIVEPEFANLLAQGKREGNTLLPALRDVWDGGSIQPLTKGKGIWSTSPHISLHGNITPGELRDRLQTREISGGTFNRILMVWAERTCLVPFPEPTKQEVIKRLGDRLATALWFAKGVYPSEKDKRPASLTPGAAELYTDLYPALRKPHPAGDLIAAATERRAPICLRVALLHAIMDQSLMITPEHIRTGNAWAEYGAATAAYVLAGLVNQTRDKAREVKLLSWLERQPRREADRTTITKDCFKNRLSGKHLDLLLTPLVEDGVLSRRECDPRAGGRQRVIYTLTKANDANIAKLTKNEQRQATQAIEGDSNVAGTAPGSARTGSSTSNPSQPDATRLFSGVL